jgi:hypothetical protein
VVECHKLSYAAKKFYEFLSRVDESNQNFENQLEGEFKEFAESLISTKL